jgi:N-methylhydantoinase A/oxoprolinase/acetone carboxylase beta subunit
MEQKGEKERYVIYVDTGGTFSDCCLVTSSGDVVHGKAPTTPQDFSRCFFDCIQDAASRIGKSLEEILENTQVIGYGTTQGTNVVVTGTGAPKLGLITTKGHEDRTLIGRQRAAGLSYVEGMHIVTADKHPPLIPKERIKGVTERIDSTGEVVIPLREDEVRQVARELIMEHKVEGIAVCFLWSFLNPEHEKKARDVIREIAPGMPVTVSHETIPKVREYPRFMSTILDLYIGLPVRKLLERINLELKKKGYKYPLLVMQASGGLTRSEIVKPITTLHSGPVGGLTGVDYWRKIYGFKHAVGTDVGGTSFDVSLSSDAFEEYLREPIVGRIEISNPMREIRTIGAGGGTIARFDHVTKRLRVGPESAEAVPGPVCYQRGGTEPTVTDADVVMGRIDPDFFLGGKMRLRKDLAISAIKEKIADPLGMSTEEAAEAICDIIDGHMEALLRTTLALRGLDPRECPVFAFGGMGPAHCAGYTSKLGVQKVIISPHAAIFSALGAATADVRHRYEISPFIFFRNLPYDPVSLRFTFDEVKDLSEFSSRTIERFNEMFEEIDKKATEDMTAEGFMPHGVTKYYEIEARYGGQLWEVRFRTSIRKIETLADFVLLVRDFEEEYIKQYGQLAMVPRGGFEIVNIAVVASASQMKPVFRMFDHVGRDPSQALKGKRNVFFKGRWVMTNVYALERLQCGNVVEGPAIIEGIDTTIVVPEDRKVTVDKFGNLIMERL